jgi:hypothetical protein
MAKGKSSIGFWLLIGTLVVGGGIGAYFLLRKPKEEKEVEDDQPKDEEKKPDGSGSGSGSGSGTATPTAPAPLDSKEKITAFQNYVLTTKKDTTILGKSGADGIWGNNSQKAWDKYGTEYSKKTPSSTPSSNTNLNKNIEFIVKNASGSKSDKTYLSKSSADFVEKWANALKNDRSAFIWENQVYRAKTGDKVLQYNPLNSIVYAKDSEYIGYENKFANTTATYYQKGKKIGKVTDYAFQNEVMLYVPDAGNNKWFKASKVTKTKPKSSFDGGNEQIEFSNFNNNFDLNL